MHAAMRTTVIHNPGAGDEDVTADALCAALHDAGHQPTYASTKADDWAAAVRQPADLVVAAGGDGTVAKVGRALLGRAVPLAVLPFGTANNIAATLRIGGPWRDIVQQLGSWSTVPFDVGIAAGAWGERPFLEGVGCGLFADAMKEAEKDDPGVAGAYGRDVALVRDVARVHGLLPGLRPRACTIALDGRTLEDEALLVAIMNISSVGPRLSLAPAARPHDGLLHVVIAREADRPLLARYLEARLEGELPPLHLEEHAAHEVSLAWSGPRLHVDDELHDVAGAPVRAMLAPGALQFLAPPDPAA